MDNAEPVRRNLPAPLRAFARRPFDSIGALLALSLCSAVLVNALYLQAGPHPSPLVGRSAQAARETTGSLTVVPPIRTVAHEADATDGSAAPRARVQLLTDIQKELAKRGFYEGAIDGIFGPKMDAAIREFEQAARLRVTGEPNEALLRALRSAKVKAQRAKSAPRHAEAAAPAAPPSRRVAAVQRALTDFGYGPLRLSGVMDEATKGAIQKFERQRKLPIKGQLSDRLLRELAAVTGRPLE
jgi:peptidoglycan hydrolase-like protein with peptidoglycan-binding domain